MNVLFSNITSIVVHQFVIWFNLVGFFLGENKESSYVFNLFSKHGTVNARLVPNIYQNLFMFFLQGLDVLLSKTMHDDFDG